MASGGLGQRDPINLRAPSGSDTSTRDNPCPAKLTLILLDCLQAGQKGNAGLMPVFCCLVIHIIKLVCSAPLCFEYIIPSQRVHDPRGLSLPFPDCFPKAFVTMT